MATKVKPSRLNVTGTPQVGDVPVYVDADSFSWGAGGGGGTGDVSGPASSTDGDIVLFDGATGKIIKDSGVGLSSKLDASALSDNNYGGAWSGDTTHTPTKNALYTKIHTMDVEIGNKAADNTVVKLSGNQTINGTKTFGTSPVVPSKTADATNTGTEIATEAQVYNVAQDVATINGKIPSAATSSNQLADKNYVDDGINSVTAYYITKNAQGDQWATRAELFAATTFYSGGVVRVPTKNDYTIVLADENHDNATTRYIYNSGWEYQYTVNETALTQAQLDALNSGITSGKVSTYDGYATGKQDTLVSGTNIKTINSTSLLGNGDIAITGVPSGGTDGQVLSKVSGAVAWANPSGGNGVAKIFNMPSANSDISDIVYWIYSNAGSAILKDGGAGLSQDFVYYDVTEHNNDLDYLIAVCTVGGITVQKKILYTVNSGVYTCSTIETTIFGGYVRVSSQSGNILTSGTKLWAGLESDYQNLGSYDSNTVYLTV